MILLLTCSTLRCIDKKDKAVSIGFATAVISLFAVVPSPIFFGWIIDQCCLFWGKTCSNKGNCWLYDTDKMRLSQVIVSIFTLDKAFIFRYSLNMTAAGFVLIGTLFDVGTWYYSKDVQIFDEKEDEEDEQDFEINETNGKHLVELKK